MQAIHTHSAGHETEFLEIMQAGRILEIDRHCNRDGVRHTKGRCGVPPATMHVVKSELQLTVAEV